MLARFRRRVAATSGVVLQLVGMALVAFGIGLFAPPLGIIAAGVGLFFVGWLRDNASPAA